MNKPFLQKLIVDVTTLETLGTSKKQRMVTITLDGKVMTQAILNQNQDFREEIDLIDGKLLQAKGTHFENSIPEIEWTIDDLKKLYGDDQNVKS